MNLVMTCLFTGCVDPQRPKGSNPDWEMRADVDQLMPLLLSIRNSDVVVFHDELDDDDIIEALGILYADPDAHRHITFERWPTPTGNIYRDRWQVYRSYLKLHADARWVWCVDGTDVKMLRPPYEAMRDDRLYTCSEQGKTVTLPWLLNNHTSVRQWARLHPRFDLLNAGLCGGDFNTVFGFLNRLIDYYFGDSDDAGDMTDMGAFNRCAWENYLSLLVYGPEVHTIFTAYEGDNGHSWWSHR